MTIIEFTTSINQIQLNQSLRKNLYLLIGDYLSFEIEKYIVGDHHINKIDELYYFLEDRFEKLENIEFPNYYGILTLDELYDKNPTDNLIIYLKNFKDEQD